MQLADIVHTVNTSLGNCSPGIPYEGRICQEPLYIQQLNCSFSGNNLSENTLTVSVVNQDDVEQYLVALLDYGLPQYYPSSDCDAAMRRFLCLYLFGPCDGIETALVGSGYCREVRDEVCVREWKEVQEFFYLPVCEDLPDDTQQHQGINSLL